MATFFSGASIGYWSSASNTMYGTLTGDVSRSGNTVTLSNMRLAITSLYASWGTSNDSFTVNGTNTGFTVNFGSGSTDAGSYALNNTSFSVGVSDTSANVGWAYYGGGQQTGQGSFTVTFPSGASAPTGLSVSIAEVYPTGARFNVSLSSYGNPSSASGRYIEAAILNQNTYGATYKYATASNTASSAITVNNSSAGGTLVVQPNKQYYYGAYASNTQLSTNKVQGQFVTKAEPPTVTFTSATTNSATFSYSASADGGHYDRTLKYSLDNGTTWVDITILTGSSAASGTFTISGLSSGTAYTLKPRATTTVGSTDGPDVGFNTVAVITDKKILYGPVNDTANAVIDLYGSVSNQSKVVEKLYAPVQELTTLNLDTSATYTLITNINEQTFINKYNAWILGAGAGKFYQNQIQRISVAHVVNNNDNYYDFYLVGKLPSSPSIDRSYSLSISGNVSTVQSVAQQWGITFSSNSTNVRDDVACTPEFGYVAKLIHQGFGHLSYS